MAETAFFRCARGAHVVGIPLGRIGIGICADNHFAPFARQMRAQRVDLMLMPHAVPAPIRTGGLVSTADMAETIAKLRGMAPLYARLLGVPAVFVNQVGARGRERWAGILGRMMGPDQFYFGGLSAIAGGDGTVTAHLDDPVEGVVAAEVCLGRRGGEPPAVPSYGRYGGGWLHQAPSSNAARDVICYVDAAIGRASYALSRRRRLAAQMAESRSTVEAGDPDGRVAVVSKRS
jgi:N-carbamoylputrescine amidase